MMPFVRSFFALLMMALVGSALVLATLGWLESRPSRDLSALEEIAAPGELEADELAER